MKLAAKNHHVYKLDVGMLDTTAKAFFCLNGCWDLRRNTVSVLQLKGLDTAGILVADLIAYIFVGISLSLHEILGAEYLSCMPQPLVNPVSMICLTQFVIVGVFFFFFYLE